MDRVCILMLLLGMTACERAESPVGLVGAAVASAGDSRLAGIMPHPGDTYAAEPLGSTCDAPVTSSYGLNFGKSGCLIVQPTGASYALTDDVVLGATTKRGRITSYQLRAHDVIGPDGVKHETEVIVLPAAVTPLSGEFIVHVHADRVPVWRLSGHVNGKREEIIGYVSVGDIVYGPSQ